MCDVLSIFFQDEPESRGWRRWAFYGALAVLFAIGVTLAVRSGSFA